MAVGDAKVDWQSKTNGSNLEIRPSGSDAWVVHAVEASMVPARVQISSDNGTTWTTLFSITTAGPVKWGRVVTNTVYARLLNDSGSTGYVGYSGRQTN
jgi:hypothetical protein